MSNRIEYNGNGYLLSYARIGCFVPMQKGESAKSRYLPFQQWCFSVSSFRSGIFACSEGAGLYKKRLFFRFIGQILQQFNNGYGLGNIRMLLDVPAKAYGKLLPWSESFPTVTTDTATWTKEKLQQLFPKLPPFCMLISHATALSPPLAA